MTMEEWIDCVEGGGFIDYDGFGQYSDGESQYDVWIYPSWVKQNRIDKTFSHVVWYNR